MTTVSYSLNEGGPWCKWEIALTVKQIIQRLNKAYDGYEKGSDGFSLANHCDALPGLGIFHAIRLPDGRIWDTYSGWRKKKDKSMEVLTKEQLETLICCAGLHSSDKPDAESARCVDYLLKVLTPYLKECEKCGGTPLHRRCPECKPERRLMQRRDISDRRRYEIIDRRK